MTATVQCTFAGCEERRLAKGWCRRHYDQTRKGNEPTELPPKAPRPERRIPITEMLSFIELAVRTETDECIDWPWLADEMRRGRWMARKVKGRAQWVQAHRIVCRAVHGDPLFKGAQAAHGCGRGCCINPRHLRWATPAQNMADKKAHGTQPRGDKIISAKLDDEMVRRIRADWKHWPMRVLAARYDVSLRTIHAVIHGQAWAHIEGAEPARTHRAQVPRTEALDRGSYKKRPSTRTRAYSFS